MATKYSLDFRAHIVTARPFIVYNENVSVYSTEFSSDHGGVFQRGHSRTRWGISKMGEKAYHQIAGHFNGYKAFYYGESD